MGLLAGGAAALVAAEIGGCVLLELYGSRSHRFGGPIQVGRTAESPAATPASCKLDEAGVFYRDAAKGYTVQLSAATTVLVSGSPLDDVLTAASIRRDGDGSYWLALYRASVQLGKKVSFLPCGVFVCPSHGARYHCDGEYLDGPAPRSLDRFPLSFDGDVVVVDTSQLNQSVA
jgi:cytochrome b6-f complex iron-sulfur subunit